MIMKFLLTSIFILFSIHLYGQNEGQDNTFLDRKGRAVLPAAGDWSIGIQAEPFLRYAGNFFSSDYNSAPYFSSVNPGQLFLKYQKNGMAAYRAGFSIGSTHRVESIGNPSDPDEFDKGISSALSFGVNFGIEKYFRFNNRLRAFYGGITEFSKEAYYGAHFNTSGLVSGNYEYKNAFSTNLNFTEKGGNTFNVSLSGVIGIEYFIIPKISIAGEYGISLTNSFTTDRKYSENDGDSFIFDPRSKQLNIQTLSSSGIMVNFYF